MNTESLHRLSSLHTDKRLTPDSYRSGVRLIEKNATFRDYELPNSSSISWIVGGVPLKLSGSVCFKSYSDIPMGSVVAPKAYLMWCPQGIENIGLANSLASCCELYPTEYKAHRIVCNTSGQSYASFFMVPCYGKDINGKDKQ